MALFTVVRDRAFDMGRYQNPSLTSKAPAIFAAREVANNTCIVNIKKMHPQKDAGGIGGICTLARQLLYDGGPQSTATEKTTHPMRLRKPNKVFFR